MSLIAPVTAHPTYVPAAPVTVAPPKVDRDGDHDNNRPDAAKPTGQLVNKTA